MSRLAAVSAVSARERGQPMRWRYTNRMPVEWFHEQVCMARSVPEGAVLRTLSVVPLRGM